MKQWATQDRSSSIPNVREHGDSLAVPGDANQTITVVAATATLRALVGEHLADLGHPLRFVGNLEATQRRGNADEFGCTVVHAAVLDDAMLGRVTELVHAQRQSVVLLVDEARIGQAVRALQRGVAEFLESPPGRDELRAAVRRALEESDRRASNHARREELAERVKVLSPRERQILDLIVEGRSSREIAGVLGISRKTVDSHRWKLARKLNTSGLAGLVRAAVMAREGGAGVMVEFPR